MSSLFSVYLLATAVQLYVQGTKFGLFCYFYVNFIDASEVMLLVVVVDKSIIQRTICSIIRHRVSIVEQFDQGDERSFEKCSIILSPLSFCVWVSLLLYLVCSAIEHTHSRQAHREREETHTDTQREREQKTT